MRAILNQLPIQLLRLLACCACLISTGWAEINWSQQTLSQDGLTATRATDINAMLKDKLLNFAGQRGAMTECETTTETKRACVAYTIHGLNGDRLKLRVGPDEPHVKILQNAEFVSVKRCAALTAARVGLGWEVDCEATDDTQVDAIALQDVFALESGATKSAEWTTVVRKIQPRPGRPISLPKGRLKLRGQGTVKALSKCSPLSPVYRLITDCRRIELKAGRLHLTVYMRGDQTSKGRKPKLKKTFRFNDCRLVRVVPWSVWTSVSCVIPPG